MSTQKITDSSKVDKSWDAERTNAILEWNEIELRITNEPTDTQRSTNHLPIPDCLLQFLEQNNLDELNALFTEDYEKEKASVQANLDANKTSPQRLKTFAEKISDVCYCRPNNSQVDLNNSALSDEKLLILAISKRPLEHNNQSHKTVLNQIYRKSIEFLGSRNPSEALHTNNWESIGFQGTDPSTDLRGVGILGLVQLYIFLLGPNNQNLVKELLILSCDPNQNFPFAVVGINLTALIVDGLHNNMFHKLSNELNSVLHAISKVYCGCFQLFCSIWKKRAYTISEFQNVLNDIRKALEMDLNRLVSNINQR